jgi:hypothetical protein
VRERLLPIALVVGGLTSSCGVLMEGDEALERAVEAAEQNEGIAILDRAGIEGDRLCVVGPYADRVEFEDVTGAEWPEIAEPSTRMSDLIDVVAVVDDGEVVAWAELDRGVAPLAVGAENGCVS